MNTSRRGFLGMLIGGVATAAAVRTFPFRVFSFPSKIRIPAVCYKELGIESDVIFTEATLQKMCNEWKLRHPYIVGEYVCESAVPYELGQIRLAPNGIIAERAKPRTFKYNPSGQNIPWRQRV